MASSTLPCELEECGYVIQRDGGMPLWVAVELLRMHQLPHVPTLPCELEGCGHVIHRNGGMPLWVAVELLGMHQLDHVPLVRQPVQQEKAVTHQVTCTQQPEAT